MAQRRPRDRTRSVRGVPGVQLPHLLLLGDRHGGGVEGEGPRQARHDPAVLAAQAVEHAVAPGAGLPR